MDYRLHFIQPVPAPVKPSIRTRITAVEATTENTRLLAANSVRLGVTITNNSPGALYLQLGHPASFQSYAVKLEAGDTYEMPFNYTGLVNGMWTTAAGNAQVVEFS